MEAKVEPYRIPRSLILFLFLLPGGCATFPSGRGGVLQDEIDEIITAPPLDQVTWGIRVVDPERGQILYSQHGHRKFIPASNMKVLSTASALSLLGPDYRYHTDLFAVGTLDAGGQVLHGDLVLEPSGDPTLSERFYPTSEAPLDSLAEGLWAAGVRTVTGSLVVDASAWDSTTLRGTWMVGDLSAAYAATGGVFSIAEGVLSVEVSAGPEEGAPASARWWPFLDDPFISVGYVTTRNDSTSRPSRTTHYLPESQRLRLEGEVTIGQVDTLLISQREPVRLASRALLHALEKRGIEVQGGLRIAWDEGESVGPGECRTGRRAKGDLSGAEISYLPGTGGNLALDCPEAELITGITSPPMADIVKALLEPSQNWMAEQLVKTMGMELGERGGWPEGLRIEREFLTQEVGVDSLDITYQDGSGLSAYNLVTPRAMVRILEFMRSSPNAGIYRNALASPGEEGSTLQNRLQSLEDRVFAKTGTITHVNSLSGFVFTNSGRELIFSIFSNGSGLPSGLVRAGIYRVLEVIARH
jgi:D-alanyl-D-alanine carboxypeptidase/D-alanyl-D-alanine-endopeptidase (penicillin-binding protein 4)